jgi:hypothetical protein
MNVSFHRLRRLSIGTLLGLTLVGAAVFVVKMRQATDTLQSELSFRERQAQHFHEIAVSFSQLGATFYQQRVKGRLELAALKAQLDAIRTLLTELERLPLPTAEQPWVAELALQENRFRTAMYAFAAAVREDPAPGFSGTVLPEIDDVIVRAANQAGLYKKAVLASIQQTHHALGQSLQWAIGELIVGTLCVLFLGLCTNFLLAHAFSRAEADRMWHAVYKLGHENTVALPPSNSAVVPQSGSVAETTPRPKAYEGQSAPPTPKPSQA